MKGLADDDFSVIPGDDATALSYIAEFHAEIDGGERDKIARGLSPQGRRVANAIFDGEAANDPEALDAAEVLKEQAAAVARWR